MPCVGLTITGFPDFADAESGATWPTSASTKARVMATANARTALVVILDPLTTRLEESSMLPARASHVNSSDRLIVIPMIGRPGYVAHAPANPLAEGACTAAGESVRVR